MEGDMHHPAESARRHGSPPSEGEVYWTSQKDRPDRIILHTYWGNLLPNPIP